MTYYQHFQISDVNGYHDEPTPEAIEVDELAQMESVRELRRIVCGEKLIKVHDPRTR